MNKFYIIGALLLAVSTVMQFSQVKAGATGISRIANQYPEYQQQQNQLPRTDPELDLEAAIKLQQQEQQNHKQQRALNVDDDNEADVVPLVQANTRQQQQHRARQRRSTPLNQLLPLQFANQQIFEDENSIRRQLSSLIAQAHNDKSIERALLKMLFNASLRSTLSNVVNQQTDALYTNAVSGADLQNFSPLSGSNSGTQLRIPTGSRSEQFIDNYSSVDSLANDLGQSFQQEQYQSGIDKREYLKPCSFNAVSCGKNPFRKL